MTRRAALVVAAALMAGAALAASGCGAKTPPGAYGAIVPAGSTARAQAASLGESLVRAIWERDGEGVRALLARGAKPDTRDEFGIPVLHLAAGDGQVDSVRALLEAGADVSLRDPDGRTALMEGAESGVAEIVTLLVARGAEVNAADALKWTALHGAAFYGRAETVKALLQAGAWADARTDRGQTPRQLAEEMGYPEVARILEKATPRVPALPKA